MRWITAVLASLRAFALAAIASSLAQAQQSGDPDDSAWASARQRGTAEAFQHYLEAFPVGRHVEDAFRSLVEHQFEGESGATRGAIPGVDLY